MRDKKGSISEHLLNLGLLGTLVYLVTLPAGPVRSRLEAWQGRVEASRLVKEHWGELAGTTGRLDPFPERPPVLVEFGDYECPYCRQAHAHLEALVDSDFTIAFRHFPVEAIHDASAEAALAAICAEFQGRFREMNRVLFETTDWQETRNWRLLAEEAQLPDIAEFMRCHVGERAAERLASDMRLARALGVSGTPTFVFQHGVHAGYLDEKQLVALAGSGR